MLINTIRNIIPATINGAIAKIILIKLPDVFPELIGVVISVYEIMLTTFLVVVFILQYYISLLYTSRRLSIWYFRSHAALLYSTSSLRTSISLG